jgi:hypothetical protein
MQDSEPVSVPHPLAVKAENFKKLCQPTFDNGKCLVWSFDLKTQEDKMMLAWLFDHSSSVKGYLKVAPSYYEAFVRKSDVNETQRLEKELPDVRIRDIDEGIQSLFVDAGFRNVAMYTFFWVPKSWTLAQVSAATNCTPLQRAVGIHACMVM